MMHFYPRIPGALANIMTVGDPFRNRLLSWRELQDINDEEVASQLYLGNDDALAVIVDRYQQLVFAVALRIVKDRSEAEEVVQIVFLDIFRKVEQFDPNRGTLKMWLLQYAYSRSINRRSYLESRRFYLQADPEESEAQRWSAPSPRRLSAGETARLIRQSLRLLHPKQRAAIERVYFEGLTLEEAAERTGETLAATRHQYYRGLMKLRDLIKAEKASLRKEAAGSKVLGLEVAGADPRPV